MEPEWIKVREFILEANVSKPIRLLHFTDLHYKGDLDYLTTVVDRINSLSPDLVCFTGDLVEEADFVAPALEQLIKIKAPLFGIPGNHDYWADVDFEMIKDRFHEQGGKWLRRKHQLERL
ncbi:MAG: metallophosphoesterase [Verrucomicrobiota bacterium]|nr:metallophosphoesterase [Verrucomicrobiota bacterium]